MHVPFADPEYAKEWSREYRRRTNDSARVLAWVEENRERRRAWCRAYKQRPEIKAKRAAGKALRRARERHQAADVIERTLIWERDQGICQLCGAPADVNDWHLDHRIALANGGTHTYDNVQVAHPRCNILKGAK